jgi:hypothetical protein
MTDYKTIFGRKIKFLTSDLDTGEAEGEIFYSDTDKEFKIAVATGAWASGTAMSTSRTLAGISGGTQTATLAYAGYLGGPGNTAATESYNGSGWSSGGNVNTARRGGAGVGTQTAALLVAGYSTESTTNVEEYNGTSWTEVTNVPNANRSAGGGIQTNAMIFANGGTDSSTYDGTNWSSGDALPAAMTQGSGATSTAILASIPPPSGTVTLEYTGSWAAGGSLNTARPSGGICAHSGPVTSALMAGTRAAPPSARVGGITEMYDGTSWTTNPATQGTARNSYMISAGSNTAAVLVGGAPYTGATEEYNFGAATIAAAAWASGGNLGTARDSMGVAQQGTQTAALVFGGYSGSDPGDNETEEYDGTSWAEQNNLNSARYSLAGAGIQTAALGFGGSGPSALNESYDGTSWTEVGDLNSTRGQLAGCGIQTAALAYGGQTAPSGLAVTEEWDGSSWTESGDLNTARYGFKGAGTQTAALAMGGVQSPPTISDDTEEYNGTSWTSVNDMLSPAFNHGASGLQTAALQFGGQTGSSTGGAKTAVATGYDGTSWSTRPSLATTRSQICGSSGTSNTSGLAVGGIITPAYSNHTEEFTGDTTSIGTAKTIDFD